VCQGCHLSEEITTKKSSYNQEGVVKDCVFRAEVEELSKLPTIEGCHSSRKRARKQRRIRCKNSPESLGVYLENKLKYKRLNRDTNKEDVAYYNENIIIIPETMKSYMKNIEDNLETEKEFEIFTDGSLGGKKKKKTNGIRSEPLETKQMGIGIVINFTTNNQEIYTEFVQARVDGTPSSTRAELWAILLALKLLPIDASATIKTDSQASIIAIKNFKKNKKNCAWRKYKNPYLLQTITDITEKKNLRVNYVKIKAHSGIIDNEKADGLAKAGAMQKDYLNLNIKLLNIRVFYKWNRQLVDTPIKEIIKTSVKATRQTEWALLNRIVKWNNKNIQKETDWKHSFQSMHGSKITELITTQEDHSKRRFCLKILNDELPTKQRLHQRKPDLYNDGTCISCNTTQEDSLHVFTCNGFINTLQKNFLEKITEKVIAIKGTTKKQLITNIVKSSSFYKIDVLRQIRSYNSLDHFSFIDIVRGLIPKKLRSSLTRIISNTEARKLITETYTDLKNLKWEQWTKRCEKFLEWEREKGITKEDKRQKTKQIRNEPAEYTLLKKELKQSCITIIYNKISNFFFKGHGLHDFFYNIDTCGVLTSSE
jgi:ribonuclease HI